MFICLYNEIKELSTMTYAYDQFSNNPYKPDKHNKRALEEGGNPNFHWGNLFDLDEDPAGNRHDPATGEKIDNSTYTGLEVLGEIAIKDTSVPDVLGKIPGRKEDKIADEWMRHNGLSWDD